MSPSMTSCSPTTTTRTTTTGDLCKTRSRNSTTIVASNPPTTEPIASNHNNNDDDNDDNDDDLDDYAKFVKSLGLDNDNHSWLQIDNDDDDDDEEDDFFWTNYEDDNEEDYIENHIDDSDEEGQTQDREAVTNASPLAEKGNKLDATTVMPLEPMTGFDLQFYKELEEELGGLEEEDLEAAVANLIGNNAKTQSHNHHADFEKKMVSGGAYENATDPYRQMMEKEKLDNSSKLRFQLSPSPTATPLKQATARKTKTAVDPEQVQWLQNLLQRHYQLLIQQAVLAIHTSYLQRNRSVKDKAEFLSGETGDDLIEILDSAVGMMQDLEQVSIP